LSGGWPGFEPDMTAASPSGSFWIGRPFIARGYRTQPPFLCGHGKRSVRRDLMRPGRTLRNSMTSMAESSEVKLGRSSGAVALRWGRFPFRGLFPLDRYVSIALHSPDLSFALISLPPVFVSGLWSSFPFLRSFSRFLLLRCAFRPFP
jgi:hypothetical protein